MLPLHLSEGIGWGQDALPKLTILIIEGDGAINNIKQRTVREPIVEVQDENHRPIAGAAVLFALPNSGAGGTFAQGLRSVTFLTDQNGRAVAQGLKLNRINGKFQMRVTASSQGRTGTAVISQTNVGVATVFAGLSLKTLLIVVAVAGAAAGGIYAGTQSGSKPSTTIVLGPPSVGGPR